MTEPPPDTRAYFRGKCLQRWGDSIVITATGAQRLGTRPQELVEII